MRLHAAPDGRSAVLRPAAGRGGRRRGRAGDGGRRAADGSRRRVPGPHQRGPHLPLPEGAGASRTSAAAASIRLAGLPICAATGWTSIGAAARLTGINESAGRRIDIDDRGRSDHGSDADGAGHGCADHAFVRYEYDDAGDLVAVIDALGHPTGSPTTSTTWCATPTATGCRSTTSTTRAGEDWRVVHAWGDGGLYDYRFEYIDVLNERRITDSLGHVSIVKLDDRGLPISEIDPLGGRTIYEYDDAGRTIGVTSTRRWRRTEYSYDERGNLLCSHARTAMTIRNRYDTRNKVTTIADPNGDVWRQAWDAARTTVRAALATRQPLTMRIRWPWPADRVRQRTGRSYGAGVRPVRQCLRAQGCARAPHHLHLRLAGKPHQQKRPPASSDTFPIRCEMPARWRNGAVGSRHLVVRTTRKTTWSATSTRMEPGRAPSTAVSARSRAVFNRTAPQSIDLYDTEEALVGIRNQRGETYRILRDALGRAIEEVDYWGQYPWLRGPTRGERCRRRSIRLGAASNTSAIHSAVS